MAWVFSSTCFGNLSTKLKCLFLKVFLKRVANCLNKNVNKKYCYDQNLRLAVLNSVNSAHNFLNFVEFIRENVIVIG